MKITKIEAPFPAVSIDDFIPSPALVRSAAESFSNLESDDWVKYESNSGQVQYCSKVPRKSTPESLFVMDYIATHFDPSKYFEEETEDVFPDLSHYGGGMMLTPNTNGEGGFLGMHVDAEIHGVHNNWKREYSVVLCISEEYDDSFDLILENDSGIQARLPYKFNRLNVFKCSDQSWHGVKKLTQGYERKTLGVMYWSKIDRQDITESMMKARFQKDTK
tara:strand:+ start:8764 stop:9420 length:657 start_codon:yes stop_codon:yes gene_type:complete